MSYAFKNTVIAFIIKYFKFILGGIVVIVMFASVYFLLLPKYLQISGEGYLDYEQKKKTLEIKQNELIELTKLKEDLSQITTVEKERLLKILPTAKEIPDIFLQMESLATESGLKVSRVSIKDAGEKQAAVGSSASDVKNKSANTAQLSGIKTITISLSVEGDSTYDSLKILLDNIEDNMRIIDLDSLSFIPSLEPENGSFSLNLNTYYLE